MESLPPPTKDQVRSSELPTYYNGCLLYYDDCTDDACKWVVYHRKTYVRCPTFGDALDYVSRQHSERTSYDAMQLRRARTAANHTITLFERLYTLGYGDLFRAQADTLKSALVELDTQLMTF